jgi:hypothetical protein
VAKEILDAWFATRYEPNPDDDAALSALQSFNHQRQGDPSGGPP